MRHVRRTLEASDLYGPAWRALRRHRPELASAMDIGEGERWVSAEAYAALLHEVSVLVGGTDRLRALGHRWSKEELGDGGHYATVRRSWLRSFGDAPSEVARLAPHLWKAAMRNNGVVRHGDEGRGFVRLVLEGAPAVRASSAWQKTLEGSLAGLLELSEPQVSVQIGPSAVDPELVDAILLWPTR